MRLVTWWIRWDGVYNGGLEKQRITMKDTLTTAAGKFVGTCKRTAREWLVPPAFFKLVARGRQGKRLQKMWCGEEMPAPRFERDYFARLNLDATTLTRQDDSRACARITGPISLPLPMSAQGGVVQFAVLADKWPKDATLKVRTGDNEVIQRGLRCSSWGLENGRWFDMRINVPQGVETLDITVSAPVHVTCPRVVNQKKPADKSVRHVIVLVLDGMTPRLAAKDHPSFPGVALTPNIDAFFADGFHSTEGYASGEWTLPTTGSMFTGVFPSRHKMLHPTKFQQLPEDRELLAEKFQRLGFHTLGMSTVNRMNPAFGTHRGFDRFIYHWAYEGYTDLNYHPAVWMSEVLGHLDVHRHDKTFSYVHLPDTHPAWNVGPLTRAFNLNRRGDSTGYDLDQLNDSEFAASQGEQLCRLRLHELDRLLGGVFNFIEKNINDETVVVLTSDHGTPWRHFRSVRPSDEPTLVNDRIQIPFSIRGPGVEHAKCEALTAPSLDLMPTLLNLIGAAVPNDLDGIDVLKNSRDGAPVISESTYGGIYEIAVQCADVVWIEKYHFDEDTQKVKGKAFYAKLFPRGTMDYSRELNEVREDLREDVISHMTKVGLISGLPS